MPPIKNAYRQKAVALKYDPSDIAPKVAAKGAGSVAEKIIQKAKDANVPVYKDEKLVEELSRIDLGDSIPPELYEVVAQVLVFIGDLDRLHRHTAHAK
jgi:flagellar biosynthesis protein